MCCMCVHAQMSLQFDVSMRGNGWLVYTIEGRNSPWCFQTQQIFYFLKKFRRIFCVNQVKFALRVVAGTRCRKCLLELSTRKAGQRHAAQSWQQAVTPSYFLGYFVLAIIFLSNLRLGRFFFFFLESLFSLFSSG